MDASFCSRCGFRLVPGIVYCPACGAPVSPGAGAPPSAAPARGAYPLPLIVSVIAITLVAVLVVGFGWTQLHSSGGGVAAVPTATATLAATPTAVPTAPTTPPAAPTATPTATPAPTPTAAPVTVAALATACSGQAVPGTEAYDPTTSGHPLVVIDSTKKALYAGMGVNASWSNGSWTGAMIQLVACVSPVKSVQTADCGQYWNSTYGWGEVLLLRKYVAVTVVRTDTGETVQTKSIYGYAMKCSSSLNPSGTLTKPPYKIYGGPPTAASINSYAAGMAK
jgi:hypothetical protein